MGVLHLRAEVETRPGIITKDTSTGRRFQLIYSRIVSLHPETNQLKFGVLGGLIGVIRKTDLTLCCTDRLVYKDGHWDYIGNLAKGPGKRVEDIYHRTNQPLITIPKLLKLIGLALKYGIDRVALLQLAQVHRKAYPDPQFRTSTSDPRLVVIRSFDMNKPRCRKSTDGVTGGSDGGLAPRDRDRNSAWHLSREGNCYQPIYSRIASWGGETNWLQFAVPGGLIGGGTKIDPTLYRTDRLARQTFSAVGELPQNFTEDRKQGNLPRTEVRADLAKIHLTSPTWTEIGEKVTSPFLRSRWAVQFRELGKCAQRGLY
ncbi:hypothetical protein EDB84DRAFT_1660163 [Lactarius hengduanensis]|nr:hypothetical protein EDB84DRAFT_1660163 [Lactarius hengduanensis]